MMRQKMNLTTKNEADQTSKDLRRIRPAQITQSLTLNDPAKYYFRSVQTVERWQWQIVKLKLLALTTQQSNKL